MKSKKKQLVLETKQYRIVMFGLDGAGKTSLLRSYLNENPADITPTHGFLVKPLDYKELKLAIWDIGGEQAAREHWSEYLASTQGVIWVVDSNDKARLDESKSELNKLLQEDQLANVPLVILWNKSEEEESKLGPLTQFFETASITDRQTASFETSAKSGKGIQEGIAWILEKFAERVA